MKKLVLVVCLLILLPAAPVMAQEDKAEKLRYDNNGWDREGQTFVLSLSCKFGIATAGEHGAFNVFVQLDIFDFDNNNWDSIKAMALIAKAEGAKKDSEGYINIEQLIIPWDRVGGTFEGVATVVATTAIIGPSGNTVGDVTLTKTIMEITGCGDVFCPGSD